jgi:trigger factor
MDDVAALKTAVTEQLQNEFDQLSKTNLKKDILDYIDEKHKFDSPPTMLDMEYKNIEDQLKLERQRAGEETPELSKSEEKEYRDIADRRVRLGLVLSQLGNENKLTVSDQDLQRSVITEAQKYPGQEKQVFDYYSKNPQALESLRAPLFEEKVIDYIIELSKIEEKDVTSEDLVKMLEEGEPKPKKPATKKKSTAKKADDKASDKKPAAKKSTAKKK